MPDLVFGRFAPTVAVSDMRRALDFYEKVLGLEKTFENGTLEAASPVPYGTVNPALLDAGGDGSPLRPSRYAAC